MRIQWTRKDVTITIVISGAIMAVILVAALVRLVL